MNAKSLESRKESLATDILMQILEEFIIGGSFDQTKLAELQKALQLILNAIDTIEGSSDSKKYSRTVAKWSKTPTSLYRYRNIVGSTSRQTEQLVERELSLIDSNCLYFSDFDNLNDPQELFANVDVKIGQAAENSLSEGSIPGSYTDKAHRILDKIHNWKSGATRADIVSNIFVCCFTKRRDNYPLWTLYAGGHTGVCIGYDRQSIERTFYKRENLSGHQWNPRLGVYDIQYSLRPFKTNVQSIYYNLVRILTTKNIDLMFEEEVRVLSCQKGKNQVMPKAVKEVIVGSRIASSAYMRIEEICSKRRIPISVAKLKYEDYGIAKSFKTDG